jgi:hypothetical protein
MSLLRFETRFYGVDLRVEYSVDYVPAKGPDDGGEVLGLGPVTASDIFSRPHVAVEQARELLGGRLPRDEGSEPRLQRSRIVPHEVHWKLRHGVSLDGDSGLRSHVVWGAARAT